MATRRCPNPETTHGEDGRRLDLLVRPKCARRRGRSVAERVVVPVLLALVCGFVPMGRVHAQTMAVEDAPTQGVEVKGVKDPALMPYRKAYDLVTGVEQAGGRLVQLLIRVTSTESHRPLPDLALSVVGDDTDTRVPVSAAGFVDVPLDKALYAADADIVANKPKKALRVDVDVVPRLRAGEIRFADIIEATSAGQAAIARIAPWYVRLAMPSLHGVSLCYSDAGQAVALGGGEQATRMATEISTDPHDVQVFCARFSLKEAAASPRTLLQPPAGWQALYW